MHLLIVPRIFFCDVSTYMNRNLKFMYSRNFYVFNIRSVMLQFKLSKEKLTDKEQFNTASALLIKLYHVSDLVTVKLSTGER